MPAGLIIKINNFGFVLTFTVLNANNTPRDLTGKNVGLYVYTQEQEPSLIMSGVCSLLPQSGTTLGQCTYLVTQTNFVQVGTFDAELEMTVSSTPFVPPFFFLEDTETFSINVIPMHPPPSL